MTTSVKPVAGDDTYTFADTQTISGNMLSNDLAGANGKLYLRDFDGDDVLAKIAGQVTDITGQYGTFHLQADGTWSYTLSDAAKVGFYAGMTLTETMQYKISDGAGHTDVGIFSLTVEATTPKPPIAVTLTFDDLVSDSNIPNNYHGFDLWTFNPYNANTYAITAPAGSDGFGYSTASQEAGGNVASNGSGSIAIARDDHATFDFEGGVFANVFSNSLIKITGWHDGVQIYSDTETLAYNTATHVALDWHNIDQIQISTVYGSENIAMDDLQFHV